MSPLEIRASLSLASIFALRMLGLFLILPVFAVYATHLQGGDNHTLVGIALGTYGLTQGMLQIPYGMASDRYGRKRVIIIGLVLFAIGSFVAAMGGSIHVIIVGRAIQGAGAISAPVMALPRRPDARAAPHQGDGAGGFEHRPDVRPVHGRLAFALPAHRHGRHFHSHRRAGAGGDLGGGERGAAGERGESSMPRITSEPARFGDVLKNPDLLRLNFGIFSLHAVQMAIFVVVPLALVSAGGAAGGRALEGLSAGGAGIFRADGAGDFLRREEGCAQAGIPRLHRPDGGGAAGLCVRVA